MTMTRMRGTKTMGTLKTIRIVLWTLVGVAALGAGYLWYSTSVAPQQGVAVAEAGRFGAGDYQLVSDAGETVGDEVFAGRPSLVFFGFTHCPDVCPTTLADMQHWFTELGPDAEDLQAFFVTVDPERDTPEILGQYVGWAGDKVTGLTGEPAEIEKAMDAWSVFAERVPLEGDDYTMNHTASVFLVDADGEFFGTIAYGESADTAIGKLRRLVAG